MNKLSMNSELLRLIQKQEEIKKMIPKGLQSIIEAQRKILSIKEAVERASLINAVEKNNAVSKHFQDAVYASRSLKAVIESSNLINQNFAIGLLGMSHLSAVRNILQQPNSNFLQQFNFSGLNKALELVKFVSKSFILPDFSEFDFEEKNEDGRIIIKISTEDIPKIIKDFYADDAKLNTINPRKFEEVIAELLRYHGYQVQLTKTTRDGGFDMILEKVLEDGRPFKALVECKRYKRKIDVEIIRCFSAVAYREGVRDGIIVTTSTFTKDARAEIVGMPADLLLKDRDDIRSWAGSYLGKMPTINLNFKK